MTAPGLVRRSRNATKRRSRLPFHLRVSDMVENGLTALSGQEATFTRASAGGLVLDRNGRLIGPHANALPRYQMHDLDGDGVRETPALLLEGQRTNLVDDQDLSTWTTIFTPVVAQSDTGPDKQDSGYLVTSGSVNAEGVQKGVTFTGDGVKCLAVWVKADSAAQSGIALRDSTAGTNRIAATITWSGDDPGTPVMTNGTFLGKVEGPDGWWRLLLRSESVTAANTNIVRLFGEGLSAGASGGTFYALPQTENATVPSSDVRTSGSTVTRSAELLQYDIGWTPADIERLGGLTVLLRWVELGTAFGSTAWYWHIGGAGAGSDPRLLQRKWTGSGSVASTFDDGTSSQTSSTGADVVSFGDQAYARTRLFLDGSDWKIQLHISTDGETETDASASTIGTSLPAAWSDGLLTIGDAPDGTFPGLAGPLSLKAAFGNRTLAQMLAAF